MNQLRALNHFCTFLLLTVASNTALAGSVGATDIACMLINEGFILGKPAVIPVPTISLNINDDANLHSIIDTAALSIALTTAATLETSVQKPFISQFQVMVKNGDAITTVRSSPRENPSQNVSVYVNLKESKGELSLECFSQ
ncbi:hypothetical protein [Agarivorans sp. DSG3-1]|uniref:hypothetical protein n=1 Tax=Agarivorans sp. DSG3-1 TaxID=3342249 RepID=UPI00398EFF07